MATRCVLEFDIIKPKVTVNTLVGLGIKSDPIYISIDHLFELGI
jgi:hypothetical protein